MLYIYGAMQVGAVQDNGVVLDERMMMFDVREMAFALSNQSFMGSDEEERDRDRQR